MFANDCILFGEATERGAQILKDILREYEVFFGQNINYEKSTMFYSLNTPQREMEGVLQIMGFRWSIDQEKYLGLPSMVGRNKKLSF